MISVKTRTYNLAKLIARRIFKRPCGVTTENWSSKNPCSSLQIGFLLPHFILGSFLCKSHKALNNGLFEVYYWTKPSMLPPLRLPAQRKITDIRKHNMHNNWGSEESGQ